MRQGRFFAWVFLALMSFLPLYSYDDTPACFKEIAVSFFQPEIVMKALNINQGYVDFQNRWVPITNELRRRAQDVPNIIKQKSDRMTPSPLEYPFQPDAAAQLLWEALYGVFNSVMHDYAIYDQALIRNMFNYIRAEQEPKLLACFSSKR